MEGFGKRLQDLRLQAGLTQKQVSELLHLKEGSYAGYERNYGNPSIYNLIYLTELFHTTAEYLIEGKELNVAYLEGKREPFTQRLRSLRKARGLTQKKTAAALGIYYESYQRYEHGKYEPKMKNLRALAQLFDVPLDDLLGRTRK